MSEKKASFLDKLPPSLIKNSKVTIFPEGALGYLVGPTLALLANSILSGNFNKYMTDVLRINNWGSAGQVFFTWLPVISVIFVVLGNILVGRLMDNIRSKAGKARPLLFVSIPISLIALVVLFLPFATDTINVDQQIMAMVLTFIGYNLWFAFAYPMYFTPHSALVNLSTRESKDRSLLATISNATALAAMGLTQMLLPFFYDVVFKKLTDASRIPSTVVGATLTEGGYYVDKAGSILYDSQASYEAWRIFAIILVAVTVIGAVIEYFFTRERVTEEGNSQGEAKKALPIGQQAKICFSDKFWVVMIIFFFLYQLGGMLKNVSQTYYCLAMFADNGVYSVEYGGRLQGLISTIGAVPTAIGMVVAWPLSNKIGKGKAIMMGAIVSTIGGIIGLIFPDNFIMVVVSFVIKALGSTPAMYLSLALLADILDHQEALHENRTDGLSMTIYGAIMAGMTGIATGILNAVIVGTGYDVSKLAELDAFRSWIPWLFTGGETIGYALICVTFFLFMNVEKFSALDHKAIVLDQKAAALKEGREYVAPEGIKEDEEIKADAALLKEFNDLRKANGRAPITL